MKRSILFIATIAVLLLSPFRSLTSCPGATAPEGTITERLAEAVNVYLDGEFDSGLAITDELLSRKSLASGDSVAILEVKSIITYAKGQKYKREAFGYLQSISNIGHCVMNFPREMWPSELRDKWYEISKSKDILVCRNDAEPAALRRVEPAPERKRKSVGRVTDPDLVGRQCPRQGSQHCGLVRGRPFGG